MFFFFFFNDTATTEIYTLSLHDALPICSGLIAVVVAIGMSIWRSRQSKLVTTYGTARWANAEDIHKAGLDQPAGVVLGLHRQQYLRHEGPEHVLTFAPTRSGKGVGLGVDRKSTRLN